MWFLKAVKEDFMLGSLVFGLVLDVGHTKALCFLPGVSGPELSTGSYSSSNLGSLRRACDWASCWLFLVARPSLFVQFSQETCSKNRDMRLGFPSKKIIPGLSCKSEVSPTDIYFPLQVIFYSGLFILVQEQKSSMSAKHLPAQLGSNLGIRSFLL